MTYIVARRFGERIVMLGDTCVSDEQGILRREGRQMRDLLPGRLKVFPINKRVSVGYAGLSEIALSAIRSAVPKTTDEFDFCLFLRELAEATKSGVVDFIVTSHVDGPQIFKVRDGSICDDQIVHWIGDSRVSEAHKTAIENANRDWENAEKQCKESLRPYPKYMCKDEIIFSTAWVSLLLRDPTLSEGVGGFPTMVLGSPFGHCFICHAGSYNPETLVIRPDGTTVDEVGRPVDWKYGSYGFSFVDCNIRGSSFLGVWLNEAQCGYLYQPMMRDGAIKVTTSDFESFCSIVREKNFE